MANCSIQLEHVLALAVLLSEPDLDNGELGEENWGALGDWGADDVGDGFGVDRGDGVGVDQGDGVAVDTVAVGDTATTTATGA